VATARTVRRDLGAYIADLGAISHLVQAQLQVLYEVAAFLDVHTWDERDKCLNQDNFNLPVLREEHNRNVLLKMVVDEHEAFHACVGGLLADARGMLRDATDATNYVRPLRPPLLVSRLTRGSTTSRRPTSTKHSATRRRHKDQRNAQADQREAQRNAQAD
jgi:hypothetical protein